MTDADRIEIQNWKYKLETPRTVKKFLFHFNEPKLNWCYMPITSVEQFLFK